MKVLITGAGGFIGSHLCDVALSQGYEVVALDSLIYGGRYENIPQGCEIEIGSITDTKKIAEIFHKHKFHCVYHFAAYAAEGLSHFVRKFNYENNVIGSMNLINACLNHGVKKFVFASSVAVYGALTPPFSEDFTPRPEDPYGIAKYSVELDLRTAHEMFGMDYVCFRLHNVYGERQNIMDPYRNVVGIFFRQHHQGKPFTIFGDGLQTRGFTHIRDVATQIFESPWKANALNQVINAGNDTAISVLELAHTIKDLLKSHSEIIHLQARKEVVHAHCSHEKFQRIFGPGKQTPLRDGLKLTFDWMRHELTSKEFRESKLPVVEVAENLPESWKSISKYA